MPRREFSAGSPYNPKQSYQRCKPGTSAAGMHHRLNVKCTGPHAAAARSKMRLGRYEVRDTGSPSASPAGRRPPSHEKWNRAIAYLTVPHSPTKKGSGNKGAVTFRPDLEHFNAQHTWHTLGTVAHFRFHQVIPPEHTFDAFVGRLFFVALSHRSMPSSTAVSDV